MAFSILTTMIPFKIRFNWATSHLKTAKNRIKRNIK
jgi:hypothetical protein